jgi:hypothetical protein
MDTAHAALANHSSVWVYLHGNSTVDGQLTPAEARELADELLAAADVAEAFNH